MNSKFLVGEMQLFFMSEVREIYARGAAKHIFIFDGEG